MGRRRKKNGNEQNAILSFLAVSHDPLEINSKFSAHIVGVLGDMLCENFIEIGSLVQELQGGYLNANSHYRLESII